MSDRDLDAVLESVRELREWLDAERRNGSAAAESVKRLQAAAAALQEPPPPATSGADWDLYERNRADIREIVKRLRNGSH